MPQIIYWNLGTVILTSIFGSLADMAMARDSNNIVANKTVCRQHIPYGAKGWRTGPQDDWKPMSELPKEWNLN
jgi:hypothetical protein